MTKREFYERCARLLNTEHHYSTEIKILNRLCHDGSVRNVNKNRWNYREPGNGRFPGRGIIRHFGHGIQVDLYWPPLHGFYHTESAALTAIGTVVNYLTETEIAVYRARAAEANAKAQTVVREALRAEDTVACDTASDNSLRADLSD